jgi:tetratricopeptide (TPR) repeat protein
MLLDDSYEAILDRGRQLAGEARFEEAVEQYRRIFTRLARLSPRMRENRPDLQQLRLDAFLEFTALLVYIGRYDELIEVSDKLAATSSEEEMVLWRISRAWGLIHKGAKEEGIAELHDLENAKPGSFPILSNLGRAYAQSKDYEKALAYFERAVEAADDKMSRNLVYMGLLDVYTELRQLDKLVETWKQAVATDPSIKRMMSLLYDICLREGDLQRATELIMMDDNPLRRGLYSGLIDLKSGDRRSAERQWERVLRREIDEQTEGIEHWMKCGLLLGRADRVIDRVLPVMAAGNVSFAAASLLGVAFAAVGNVERADSVFRFLRDSLDKQEGDRLSSNHWKMLNYFVQDETVKAALKHHFYTDDDQQAESEEPGEAETTWLEVIEQLKEQDIGEA